MDSEDKEIFGCQICGKIVSQYDARDLELPDRDYFNHVCIDCKIRFVNVCKEELIKIRKECRLV